MPKSMNLLRSPYAAALAYYLAALGTLHLSDGVDGIATIWPASGILVSALLFHDRRGRIAVLLATALASFAANLQAGAGAELAVTVTMANLAEGLVAMALIGRIPNYTEFLYRPAALLWFIGAAFVSGLAGASFGLIALRTTSLDMFVSWFTTVTLGLLLVVPLIVQFVAQARSGSRDAWRISLKMMGVALMVIACALLVFGQNRYPLLYLMILAVLTATYTCGPKGAIGSTLIVAVVGTAFTSANLGPIHLMETRHASGFVLFFQLYLFVTYLAAMVFSALLQTRNRAFADLTRANQWLELSETFSDVGHWRVETADSRVFWSDQVFRIHGLEPGLAPSLEEAIGFYHPDDRQLVEDQLQIALETRTGFEFESRLVHKSGEIRHVLSRGRLEFDAAGAPVAIFGIFQDITASVLARREILRARETAEELASDAWRLANTDPLTGIANRRKIMADLDQALEDNRRTGARCAVALIDIDNFKTINDTLGHAVGDQVIRQIAALGQAAVRSSDALGRIGGEEYLIVFPDAGIEVAANVAERLRQTVERHDWSGLSARGVTISVGVAEMHGDANVEALCERADTALYEAKRDGRNLLRRAA